MTEDVTTPAAVEAAAVPPRRLPPPRDASGAAGRATLSTPHSPAHHSYSAHRPGIWD